MTEMFRRATPGDPLSGIPSEVYNLMLDSLRDYMRRKAGEGTVPKVKLDNANIIRNESGSTLDQFSIVGIGDTVIFPTAEESEFFFGDLVYESALPTADGRFAILQRPVPDGDLAPAVISGWSVARIDMQDADHEYAAPEDGNYDTLLSQSDPGPVQIFKIADAEATQLNGAINGSVTEIEVDAETPLAAVPFVVLCGTEKMLVTATDGTTWTVTRGYASTTPASHSDNAAVTFTGVGVVWAVVLLTGSGGGLTEAITSINGKTGPAITISSSDLTVGVASGGTNVIDLTSDAVLAISDGADEAYGDALFHAITILTDTSGSVDPVFVASDSTVTLYLSPASATVTGLVVPLAQTWAGNKTFTGNVYVTNTAPVIGIRNTTGGLGASQVLLSYGDYVASPTVNTLQIVADSALTSYIGTYHAGLSGGYSVGLIYNSLAGTIALSATNGIGAIIAGAFVVSIAGGTYATGQTGTLVDGSVVNGGIITSIGTDGMTHNKTYRLMSMGLH